MTNQVTSLSYCAINPDAGLTFEDSRVGVHSKGNLEAVWAAASAAVAKDEIGIWG